MNNEGIKLGIFCFGLEFTEERWKFISDWLDKIIFHIWETPNQVWFFGNKEFEKEIIAWQDTWLFCKYITPPPGSLYSGSSPRTKNSPKYHRKKSYDSSISPKRKNTKISPRDFIQNSIWLKRMLNVIDYGIIFDNGKGTMIYTMLIEAKINTIMKNV